VVSKQKVSEKGEKGEKGRGEGDRHVTNCRARHVRAIINSLLADRRGRDRGRRVYNGACPDIPKVKPELTHVSRLKWVCY